MRDLWRAVSENQVLNSIDDLLPGDTFLVGGCVRDFLLGAEPQDFDIITASDVWPLALSIASRLHTHPFWIDRDRMIARITDPATGACVDIAPPKKAGIEEDLWERDITINAVGYDIRGKRIMDPTGGVRDLRCGLIRIVSDHSLADDPVRSLRCIRFSLQFDFSITEESFVLLRKQALHGLAVAPERIKQELVKTLNLPHGSRCFSLLESTGYLKSLFPEAFLQDDERTRGQIIRHAVRTADHVDRILPLAHLWFPGISDHFQDHLESGVSRAVVLRLAAFLHGIAGGNTAREKIEGGTAFPGVRSAFRILQDLTFSSRSSMHIDKILQGVSLLGSFCPGDFCSNSTLHRFCSRVRGSVPEVLLLAMAHAQEPDSTPEFEPLHLFGRDDLDRVWTYCSGPFRFQIDNPLVTGHDVITELGISPGPCVGAYLQIIEEARAEGKLTSRQKALEYLRRIGRERI